MHIYCRWRSAATNDLSSIRPNIIT
jgi:hypothetical protein